MRRIQEQRPPDNPKHPPQKQSSGGGGGPSPSQPQPQAQQPLPSAPTPQVGTPQSSSAKGGGMTRVQADRLLNALQELARADQQKRRPVRAVNEKRGRDW
jgi:hypothetical protein